MLASEQFIKLAHTVLRSRKVSEALAIILPGNPAFVEETQLNEIADHALDEIIARFRAYPA